MCIGLILRSPPGAPVLPSSGQALPASFRFLFNQLFLRRPGIPFHPRDRLTYGTIYTRFPYFHLVHMMGTSVTPKVRPLRFIQWLSAKGRTFPSRFPQRFMTDLFSSLIDVLLSFAWMISSSTPQPLTNISAHFRDHRLRRPLCPLQVPSHSTPVILFLLIRVLLTMCR